MKWKEIDPRLDSFPSYLKQEDKVWLAYEYVPRTPFSECKYTRLIFNFKRPLEKIRKEEWRSQYKKEAIAQCIKDLIYLFPKKKSFLIAFIPTSKTKDDPDYDDRLDQVLKAVTEKNSNLILEAPFTINKSVLASHMKGSRDPKMIKENFRWKGFSSDKATLEKVEGLVLFDDVITSGAHFSACKSLILEHHPDLKVFGLFWFRAM